MRVLVDTSVWLEHFRGRATPLEQLLLENAVLTHSIVIGELSCGNIKSRRRILGDLKLLPAVQEAAPSETLELIESRRLYGKGLGYGDLQLLASALTAGVSLLSFDKALHRISRELRVSA